MDTSLEVLFTPAEFDALAHRDLSRTTCVVFDVLRATTTMLTALANGAEAIVPVSDIPEALRIKREWPDVLLAGERDGVRILADRTGGIDFDLGNSPREFTPDRVRGRRIVMTTTNGTRALRACAGAQAALIGSFPNLEAVARWIDRRRSPKIVIVCSGTYEQAALEDTLAAGALCEKLGPMFPAGEVGDSVEVARRTYATAQADLPGAVGHARNGRRLLDHPALRDDVAICLQRNTLDLVAGLTQDGAVKIID